MDKQITLTETQLIDLAVLLKCEIIDIEHRIEHLGSIAEQKCNKDAKRAEALKEREVAGLQRAEALQALIKGVLYGPPT